MSSLALSPCFLLSTARTVKVKNRAPAPIQITAEQLLREAQERQEGGKIAPRQRVEDIEELHEYRGRKRKQFEETIRRARSNLGELPFFNRQD
jgi:crooked neck